MKSKAVIPVFLILTGCGASDGTGNSTSSSVLSGSWISDCQEYTDRNNDVTFEGSFTWQEAFYTDEINSTMRIYEDEACQGNLVVSKRMIGSYALGEKFIDESGVEAQAIDFDYESENIVGSHAGINNDVLGIPTPSVYLDVFYVDGTDLYYGDVLTGNGSTERPTRLDLTYAYRKQ